MKPVRSISANSEPNESGTGIGEVPSWIYQENEPVLIKGLVNHWPVVQAAKQSPDAAVDLLKQFYSGRTVVVYEAEAEKAGRFFYSKDCSALDFKSSFAPLDAVLDKILSLKNQESAPTVYVGSTTVDVCLPGLREQNDLAVPDENPLVSIWLGNRSRVAAHFDAPDNLACCIAGERRFTLFPTEQVKNLYVGPLDFTPSGQAISMVDTAKLDADAHPKYAEALKHALVADMEPGDALYLPSMWWHQVESFSDFNGLINYWWRDVPKYFEPPINVLHHAMLSIRDLPAREKAAWKALFDFYIFDEQDGQYDHIPEQARGFLKPMDEMQARRLRTWLLNKLNR